MRYPKGLKEHKRSHPNGSVLTIHSNETRKEAVKRIDNGEITVEEARDKYNVQHTGTIYGWLRKYSKYKYQYRGKKRLTTKEKIRIISEYDRGLKSAEQICKEFKVIPLTVQRWIKLYSCGRKINQIGNTVNISENTKKESKKFDRELEDAKLKIASLETMIDIAEKEFEIQIRKKCGTKQ